MTVYRGFTKPSLWEGVVGALIAGLALLAGGWLVSHAWFVPLGLAVVWVLAVFLAIRHVNRRVLFFVRPMSEQTARERILSANKVIWSLQISGSEFTRHSDDAYEGWLREDEERRLKIAFANPENDGLLRSINKLTGIEIGSTEEYALEDLRKKIIASIEQYTKLQNQLPGQVDVRVYDCCPPYSIHAADPNSRRGSIFLEFYLPHVPASERPCTIMRHSHKRFEMYSKKSLAWFEDGTRASSQATQPA
jgi:hypothetical protein